MEQSYDKEFFRQQRNFDLDWLNSLFADLRVVELAGVLAGPSAGHFFAELGARVIKIENPATAGDVTRSWKLRSEDPSHDSSAYFWSVNGFKEFLSLDLSTKKDRERLYEICKTADIVIANYKSGDDKKLGVDYDHLASLNPGLIYASINGFGDQSKRAAYDLILQAESGFMSINGEQRSTPLKMPVALIDVIAGHQIKEAILIALLRREREKKGSYISVSLFDSAIASLVNQATNWLIGKELPRQMGSLHPNIAPYGEVFETRDKQLVTFAIGSTRQFRSLCKLLGNTALSKEPSYATNQLRVSNRQALYRLLYDLVKEMDYAALFRACLSEEVPLGKIRNIREVFELPEARAMLRNANDGKKKIEVVTGIAFRFHK